MVNEYEPQEYEEVTETIDYVEQPPEDDEEDLFEAGFNDAYNEG